MCKATVGKESMKKYTVVGIWYSWLSLSSFEVSENTVFSATVVTFALFFQPHFLILTSTTSFLHPQLKQMTGSRFVCLDS